MSTERLGFAGKLGNVDLLHPAIHNRISYPNDAPDAVKMTSPTIGDSTNCESTIKRSDKQHNWQQIRQATGGVKRHSAGGYTNGRRFVTSSITAHRKIHTSTSSPAGFLSLVRRSRISTGCPGPSLFLLCISSVERRQAQATLPL